MNKKFTIKSGVGEKNSHNEMLALAEDAVAIFRNEISPHSQLNGAVNGFKVVGPHRIITLTISYENGDIVGEADGFSGGEEDVLDALEKELSNANVPASPSMTDDAIEDRVGTEDDYDDDDVDSDVEIVGGKTKFTPPFTKTQAAYHTPREADKKFPNRDDYCKNCVHYLEGGGCKFVRGEIDPEAVCEDFYSDFGVFADEEDMAHPSNNIHITAYMFGEIFDWNHKDVEKFIKMVKDRMDMEADNS